MGAIYKFACDRGLGKEKTISLMVDNLDMNEIEARRLAEHWYTTEKFKRWAIKNYLPNQ